LIFNRQHYVLVFPNNGESADSIDEEKYYLNGIMGVRGNFFGGECVRSAKV